MNQAPSGTARIIINLQNGTDMTTTTPERYLVSFIYQRTGDIQFAPILAVEAMLRETHPVIVGAGSICMTVFP